MTAANGHPAGDTSVKPIADLRSVTAAASQWLARNRRMALLVVPSAAYLTLCATVLLGPAGLAIGAMASLAIAILGPRISADTMLTLYRAEPLGPGQGASLREIIAALSTRAELAEPPALAIVPSLAAGVFACGSGRRRALLITEGLLRRQSLPEIAALAAHEIAHMKAGDLPLFSLADATTRVAQAMFYLGVVLVAASGVLWLVGEAPLALLPIVLLLLAPALSSQLQLRLPREHDLAADLLAARLIGDRSLVAQLAAASPTVCGSPIDDLRLPVPQRRVPLPSPLRAHTDGPSRAQTVLTTAEPHSPLPPLQLKDGPLISLVGLGPVEMRPRDRWPGLWF